MVTTGKTFINTDELNSVSLNMKNPGFLDFRFMNKEYTKMSLSDGSNFISNLSSKDPVKCITPRLCVNIKNIVLIETSREGGYRLVFKGDNNYIYINEEEYTIVLEQITKMKSIKEA